MRLWIWPWFIVPSITTGPLVPAAERWTRPRCDLNRPVFVVIGPFLLFQQMKKSYRTFSDIWMDFFFFSSFELSNSWIGIWQTLISSVRPTFTMKTWITAETLQRLLCSRETLCLSDSWVSTSLNKPFSSWIWPDGRHHNPHTEQYSRNSEEYPYLHSFSRTKYCSGRFRRDILEFACFILDQWCNEWSMVLHLERRMYNFVTGLSGRHKAGGARKHDEAHLSVSRAAVLQMKISTAILSGGKCAK